jgi:hypothetical protein
MSLLMPQGKHLQPMKLFKDGIGAPSFNKPVHVPVATDMRCLHQPPPFGLRCHIFYVHHYRPKAIIPPKDGISWKGPIGMSEWATWNSDEDEL